MEVRDQEGGTRWGGVRHFVLNEGLKAAFVAASFLLFTPRVCTPKPRLQPGVMISRVVRDALPHRPRGHLQQVMKRSNEHQL